jgi:hypothetical protein
VLEVLTFLAALAVCTAVAALAWPVVLPPPRRSSGGLSRPPRDPNPWPPAPASSRGDSRRRVAADPVESLRAALCDEVARNYDRGVAVVSTRVMDTAGRALRPPAEPARPDYCRCGAHVVGTPCYIGAVDARWSR